MPRLTGGSGHLKLFGGLTLGDALSLPVEILLERVGSLEAVPELMAVEIVAVWKIDYSAHGYLPLKPLPSSEKR
jgi:hypothetical protein